MNNSYTNISFPSLGIDFDPIRVIEVGPFSIHIYGILIGLGLMLAIIYGWKRSKEFGFKLDDITDGVLCVVPFAILCARLYYCIFRWEAGGYAENPISVLYIWEGGLAIYGGVIGAAIGVTVYCYFKKLKLPALLDLVALGFLIGQSIGRWGNFFNREVFGGYTDSLLAMKFPASMARASDISADIAAHMSDGCIQVHPTFLYEGIWNFCLLMLLIFALKYKKFHGQIILLYLMGYGIGRALIESIRTDQLFIPGTTVPVNMVMGICVAIAALTAIVIGISRAGNKDEAEKA